MIAFLKGKIAKKSSDFVVIEVGGIGYCVYMSSNSLNTIGKTGEEVQVFTYLQVREDMLNLYGFKTEDELLFFETLIQVSGIGPKGALAILGGMSIPLLQQAIIEENESMLIKAPGVGKKTAQRIIVELKDKVSKLHLNITQEPLSKVTTEEKISYNQYDDCLSALESLGYSRQEASITLQKLTKELGEGATVEDYVKMALKQLAR